MSRSDTLEREYEVDVDLDEIGEDDADREPESSGGGLRSRLPSPSVPSPSLGVLSARGLGLSLVACLAGFLAASFLVPLGGVSGLIGLFVVGFLLGGLGRGTYVEIGLAGAGTAAVGTVLSQFVLAAVAELAVPVAAVGGTAGLLAAVLGCYFGRDLRAGLTRSV